MTRSSSGHAPRHKKAAKKRSTSKRTVRKKAIRKKAASKQAVRRKATRKQSASKRTVRKKPPKRKSVAKKAAGKQSAGSPKTRIDPSEADAGGQESIPPEQLIGWEVSRFWIEIRGTESSVQLMRVLLMAFAGVAKEKRDKFLEEHAHVHVDGQ